MCIRDRHGIKRPSRSRITLYGDRLRLEASDPRSVDIGRGRDTIDQAYTWGEGMLVRAGLHSLSILHDIGEPLYASPEEELQALP